MYRIGVDVGGTFTDPVCIDESGNAFLGKVLTTRNPAVGFFKGLEEIASQCGLSTRELLRETSLLVHGTTITINTLLSGSGAKVSLIATQGFLEPLELRYGVRERIYDNWYVPPKPLVPRYLRYPLEERVTYDGKIRRKPSNAEIVKIARQLRKNQTQAVAVCLLHSYQNPINEQLVAALLGKELPGVYLSLSSRVVPEIRIYERTSTTVINSYLGPIFEKYVKELLKMLAQNEFRGQLFFTQLSGGMMSAEVALERPVATVMSGPASGAIAGAYYASLCGFRSCISMDMGGTSFEACLINDGEANKTTRAEFAGHHISIPAIDFRAIGAGGGSIAWVDSARLLKVGPRSAAADPGPACYGKGGVEPTVTDADCILGYIDPNNFWGGRMKLDLERAKEAIRSRLSNKLGLSVEEAALGIVRVAATQMAATTRAITIECGLDPRDFILVVAGGAGPIHAVSLANELEIPLMVVPRNPGSYSAMGVLLSDIRQDFVRTYKVRLREADFQKIRKAFDEMRDEGVRILNRNTMHKKISLHYSMDMRYEGQYHELTVKVSESWITARDVATIERAFHDEHNNVHGYMRQDDHIELINIRLSVVGCMDKPEPRTISKTERPPAQIPFHTQKVLFQDSSKYEEVKLYSGHELTFGDRLTGPCLIQLPTTTILVDSKHDLGVDRYGTFLVWEKSKFNLVEELV